jgi:hypothetical protein
MQLSRSLPLQPVVAACHCCLYLLPVTAACHCWLSLQPATATCHFNMSLLPVTAACHCCLSLLLDAAASALLSSSSATAFKLADCHCRLAATDYDGFCQLQYHLGGDSKFLYPC